jgi:hypothetical protein
MFESKAGSLLEWSTSQELYSNIILLDLATNIRLGCKSLLGTNTSLLRRFVKYSRKKFYNIDPWTHDVTLVQSNVARNNKNWSRVKFHK